MNDKEFESVLKQPANIRYEYFVKKVVDHEEVWGLYDEGWAVTKAENNIMLLPVWPKKEFAEHCAIEEWRMYSPKQVDIHDFINEFMPKVIQAKLKPSVFWNNVDSAVVEAQTLLRDLNLELKKY